jgi:hypothetical protein
MTGGTISNNETSGSGGGVDVYAGYGGTFTFTMKGGTISGNKATGSNSQGGGVAVNASISGSVADFTMEGGTLSRNEADAGGGVFVHNATFTKELGAVIYGSGEGENSNTAGMGSAVYVDGGKQQETTAGVQTSLSAVFNSGSYTYTGDWDP